MLENLTFSLHTSVSMGHSLCPSLTFGPASRPGHVVPAIGLAMKARFAFSPGQETYRISWAGRLVCASTGQR